MTKHSLLSPSSASRWLACSPSAKLESTIPNTGSSFASEGTLAHKLAAALVDLATEAATEQQYAAVLTECQADEQWNDEMLSHAYAYRDYIMFTVVQPDTFVMSTEVKVSMEYIALGMFGTADFVAFDGETVDVVDFKYGKGVPVSPEDNAQMKLYAAGVLDWVQSQGVSVNIKNKVRLHIVQPRISEPLYWDTTVEDIQNWAINTVRPAAERAIEGRGDFNPGKDTCRFCRAKPVCRALRDDVFKTIEYNPAPDKLTLGEVGEVMAKASLVKTWLNSLMEYALGAMLAGKEVKGWKLVAGKSNRKITNELEARSRLRKEGFEDTLTHSLRLNGITALERLVGKTRLPEILGDVLVKPEGAPTMVEESDPRPAMQLSDAVLKEFESYTF